MTDMAKKDAAPKPGNHITEGTETLVVRLPKGVKRSYQDEAEAAGVPMSDLIREDLARGLKRRGY